MNNLLVQTVKQNNTEIKKLLNEYKSSEEREIRLNDLWSSTKLIIKKINQLKG